MRPSMKVACPMCGTLFTQYQGSKRGRYPLTCSRSCGRKAEWAAGIHDHQRRPVGATYINNQGYVLVRQPDHPRCYKNGWMLEHVIVMERHLGRYLVPGEYVHHKNGVRADNRPENLELWSGRKDAPGQRMVDYVISLIEKMGLEDRQRILEHLKL